MSSTGRLGWCLSAYVTFSCLPRSRATAILNAMSTEFWMPLKSEDPGPHA